MTKVYLALYKHKPKLFSKKWLQAIQDGLIRFFSKGQYSHCEIVVEKLKNYVEYDYHYIYECYSSSPRDAGVRMKQIDVQDGKWDLVLLSGITEQHIRNYFEKTKVKKYDWFGVFGLLFGIPHSRSKFFCSEWCFNVIRNSEDGWRFSPNQLAVMFKNS